MTDRPSSTAEVTGDDKATAAAFIGYETYEEGVRLNHRIPEIAEAIAFARHRQSALTSGAEEVERAAKVMWEEQAWPGNEMTWDELEEFFKEKARATVRTVLAALNPSPKPVDVEKVAEVATYAAHHPGCGIFGLNHDGTCRCGLYQALSAAGQNPRNWTQGCLPAAALLSAIPSAPMLDERPISDATRRMAKTLGAEFVVDGDVVERLVDLIEPLLGTAMEVARKLPLPTAIGERKNFAKLIAEKVAALTASKGAEQIAENANCSGESSGQNPHKSAGNEPAGPGLSSTPKGEGATGAINAQVQGEGESKLREALKAVRADILNEHGLNSESIVCTVWHSSIETTVDFIDAALSTGIDGERGEASARAPDAWDHRYRRLEAGELIVASDEVQNDDGSWRAAVCVGQQAPDPAYTSHRVYRRLIPTQSSEGEKGEKDR